MSLNDCQVARQSIDDLRTFQESFKYSHDIDGDGVIRQANDDDALVMSGWVPADISEIQISSNDGRLHLTCSSGNQLVGCAFQPYIVDMIGLMACASKGGKSRTRKIGVDQETHGELARRQGMKRFLFYEFARKLQGRADVGRGKVVLALNFLESHAAGKTSDDDRHGYAGATDDGSSVANSGIDDYEIGHADAASPKSARESTIPSGCLGVGVTDMMTASFTDIAAAGATIDTGDATGPESKGRSLAKLWLRHGLKVATISRPAQDNPVADTMTQQALFQNIHRTDPLEFWSKHGLDYRKVTDFLDLNTDELSKIGGVSKRSVRLDSRIPYDLKVRLEQIANICALVAGYFEGDIEKTALWFRTPNPMLGDISPRDMIRFGRYKRLLKFVTEAREANTSSAA